MGAALTPVQTGKSKPAPRSGFGSNVQAESGEVLNTLGSQLIAALLLADPLAHKQGIVQLDAYLSG